MEITCPACQSRFTLKTDKLPKGPFRVVCGKCRHPFTVDPAKLGVPAEGASPAAAPAPAPAAAPAQPPAAAPRAPAPAVAPAPAQRSPAPAAASPAAAPAQRSPAPAAAAPAAAAVPEAPQTSSGPAQGPPVEEFSENLKLALLCVDRPDLQPLLAKTLAELGYKAHVPPGHKEALMWVYQNKYEVVLIDEEFAQASPDNNEVLQGFAFMTMQLRRTMCVGLIGKSMRSMDNMIAFHRSVNFVVNERDCARAKAIIRSAVTDNDEFYRTYKEVMKQLGKV